MNKVEELFKAHAGEAVDPSAEVTGYSIEIEFLGGLTDKQKEFFKAAAMRWTKIITGDVPEETVEGRKVDDLLIRAKGEKIDGANGVLARAGPRLARAKTFLPITAEMTFDLADLPLMEKDGTIEDVITHEMGHCIGLGSMWAHMKLVAGAGSTSPTFIGAKAKKEYGVLVKKGPTPVPLETTGGAGTRDTHWSDTVFGNEMMSGYVEDKGNPISRVTIGALEDMGYVVDYAAADSYKLPALARAKKGHACRILPTEVEVLRSDAERLMGLDG